MTKYVRVGEMVASRIKKGKKACRKAFRQKFFSFLLCWFLTAVVTFAAWGVYVFFDFVIFFLDLPLDFLAVALGFGIAFPLYVGNVGFAKGVVKGKDVDVYVLFDGYFKFKEFWTWVFFNVVALSPSWLLGAIVGVVSNETGRFFPFLKDDVLFYVSVLLEIMSVTVFFFNLCKSLYFLSFYELTDEPGCMKRRIETISKRYSKRKKYFRRYILAHLHLIVILILSRAFPLFWEAIVFTFILGYFALCLPSFSEGFELKFKKYKSERSEKRYEK